MGSARAAGAIWLLGAAVYLVCEAVAAARFDGYSYAGDYISDLGVDPVMNVGAFMVHGILFLAGAVAVAHHFSTSAGRAFVLAASANAIGNILVGTFQSGTSHGHWHVVGAGLAIVGGNVAVVLGGLAARALGAPPSFRWVSVALGTFGIVCLSVLILDGANGSRIVAPGLVERGSVYTIIAWELLAGAMLLCRATPGLSVRRRPLSR